MQTIVIVLDAMKMINPDLNIRYTLPDRIEKYTNNQIKDNGYDYLSENELGIWLETDDSIKNVEQIIKLLNAEKFLENDLLQLAQIYISEEECAAVENCRKIYPVKL